MRLSDIDLLTPRDVARIMRVHLRTVTEWVRDGLIPSRPNGDPGAIYTPGGQIRIHHDAFDLLLLEGVPGETRADTGRADPHARPGGR